MLVLSRKKNQSILIGDNVELRVLRISNNIVRIGIQAPPEVPIRRSELVGRERAVGPRAVVDLKTDGVPAAT